MTTTLEQRFRTLSDLPVGSTARIDSIEGQRAHELRLMEMGLIPGTIIRVIRVAPFGDPIDVLVRGYHLSLRRNESSDVLVTPVNDEALSW